jgi:hypothetical protein
MLIRHYCHTAIVRTEFVFGGFRVDPGSSERPRHDGPLAEKNELAKICRMSAESKTKRQRFPIIRAIWRNWRTRHQDPRNFAIHLVGIPLAVVGFVLLFIVPWYWGGAMFVLGYLLQWVGHRWEGNDVGEWAAIKRLLGLPTVAISPRYAKPPETPPVPPSQCG